MRNWRGFMFALGCFLLNEYTRGCKTGAKSLISASDTGSGAEYPDGKEHFMEQRIRLGNIEKQCKKYDDFLKQQSWKDSVPRMIVDDEKKLLFCALPKVASSNWKRVFINALNITVNGSRTVRDVHARNLLPDLRNYSRAEQEYRLKNYFKFMFVRNPLERLLSAYTNKLEHREIEWISVKRHVKDHKGHLHQVNEVVLRVKNPEKKVPESGRTITFSQFVNTLTDPAYRIKHFNVHWKQYNKLCHPCFVRYDFIGKVETFARDLDFVKWKTGLEYQTWFDKADRSTTPLVVKEYYRSLSPRKVATLLRMYESDISMFGYD